MKLNFLPIAMAFCANAILGASSIYWHLFQSISPVELVGYRVVFSLILLAFIVVLTTRISVFLSQLPLQIVALHIVAAILVAVNWGTFIWASINGSVLESGLGYLIAPIFTMLVGIVFLAEPAYREKVAAIAMIIAMLVVLILFSPQIEHWVYWSIGLTWGGYTVLKKTTNLNPVNGLFVETIVLLLIFGSAYILILDPRTADISGTLSANPLLMLCGVVSVTPLVMFSYAARKLDAYTMGSMQFVLPSVQLLVSILYYQQTVSALTYLCFSTIWIILIIATMIDIRMRSKLVQTTSALE